MTEEKYEHNHRRPRTDSLAGAYTAESEIQNGVKDRWTDGRTNVPLTGMSYAIKSADLHLRLLGRKRTLTARPARGQAAAFLRIKTNRYARMIALDRAPMNRRLMRLIRS